MEPAPSAAPTAAQPAAPAAVVDVLVVGGGPAGLSAALTLGRSRRNVLVVDDGTPRNAPAAAMHAFLTRDGTLPAQLMALAREEVTRYSVGHLDARAVGPGRRALPVLPRLGGPRSGHRCDCDLADGSAPGGLFRQLSDRVVVLRHTVEELDADRLAVLAARGVEIVDGEVIALEVHDDRLAGVALADGTVVALDALAAASRVTVRGELLDELGIAVAEHPSGMGLHVPADPMGRTTVADVWVAGNVTDPSAQVIVAAAQGNRVGAFVNAELVAEDETHAMARPRQDS